jgi:hypothetical protein
MRRAGDLLRLTAEDLAEARRRTAQMTRGPLPVGPYRLEQFEDYLSSVRTRPHAVESYRRDLLRLIRWAPSEGGGPAA